MQILYTMPGTCALAPSSIAVAWTQAPVEMKTMAHGDHKKDAYLAINPQGKVPSLTFEDGDVLTEDAAFMAWIGSNATSGSRRVHRDRLTLLQARRLHDVRGFIV